MRDVEAQIERHHSRHDRAAAPSADEFHELARDLEAVWSDPETDARLKKRILRTLIRDIIVDIDDQAAEVVVVIHWKGGVHTELRLPRRRRGQNATHTSREADWPGYFGTPAIGNVAAGRRKMDGLAAAAVDAALKALDGTLPATAPRVADRAAADPVFEQITDASLENDRQVEKNEMDWLAATSRAVSSRRR